MEQITTRGGSSGGTTHLGAPGSSGAPSRGVLTQAHLMPIFLYISHFDLEKNKERTFGMEHRRLEAKLGQEHFCPLAERFRRGNFPPEGEIIVIIITNNYPILGRVISIDIFNNTISSQTLVHLLCSILLREL